MVKRLQKSFPFLVIVVNSSHHYSRKIEVKWMSKVDDLFTTNVNIQGSNGKGCFLKLNLKLSFADAIIYTFY